MKIMRGIEVWINDSCLLLPVTSPGVWRSFWHVTQATHFMASAIQQYSSLKKSEQCSLNLTVIISTVGKQLHHLQFLQIRFLDAWKSMISCNRPGKRFSKILE